jgi:hypothetical protein
LTIQCKNQTIQRFYKDDGSVQMKVSGSVSWERNTNKN